ncbi:MAG: prepilin-type N-terminal cleavage/methylation domain-containing protein [Lachnospiraceae bacterium]|nr:prepilin-type N-terminal cleavage/methylation domain-containing protein [Lachnospiraceae bacterium]
MTVNKRKQSNKGSTLLELIVCFALLGIFMSAAAVVITNVTNVFFDVKGQTYGRQVADIILSKITGEIEGAKLSAESTFEQPIIYQDPADELAGNRSGYKIDLYDRTDTHIQMYEEDGVLKIRYFEINPPKDGTDDNYKNGHINGTVWTFDEAVYQGYTIKSLRFVPADQGVGAETADAETIEGAAYANGTVSGNDYPGNVIGVYLTLQSPQYGEFYAYRYVKMYNITDTEAQNYKIQLLTSENYGD